MGVGIFFWVFYLELEKLVIENKFGVVEVICF